MFTEVTVTIGHDHPSLAGHFPGNPVVPGVVILGEVIEAIGRMGKHTIQVLGMPSVKFVSPLRPGETLVIRLEAREAGEAIFRCMSEGRLIATGHLQCNSLPQGEDNG